MQALEELEANLEIYQEMKRNKQACDYFIGRNWSSYCEHEKEKQK